MIKTYLTEYTDKETNKTWAGPKIEAGNFEEAKQKLLHLLWFGMVPGNTEIIGEWEEILDLSV